MKLDKIEPITDDVLDKIKEHFDGKDGFRISDRDSHGDRYFLFSRLHWKGGVRDPIEFTIIWIGSGVWQIRYLNTQCVEHMYYKTPLDELNELIKDL